MNLAQLDLNLLVALDALLRERNVTRAGESIGLSQPAMSSALARLRHMFGDELLVRVGREYSLTALAQDMEAPLQDILRLIELTIERRPSFDPSTDTHSFTISASDYSTYLLVQPLLQRISAEAPAVSIQVLPLDSRSRPALENGDIDLMVMPASIGPDMPSAELFVDRYVAIAWKGNRDVGDSLTLDRYLALQRVAYGRGLGTIEGTADRAIHDPRMVEHIRLTVESFFMMPFLVIGTPLVALVHERMARRLSAVTDIRILEPLFDTPPVCETMYWHPRRTSDPAHMWMRNKLLEIGSCVES